MFNNFKCINVCDVCCLTWIGYVCSALANLGVVYSEQGRLQEAEEAYRRALQYAPTMADTHFNL